MGAGGQAREEAVEERERRIGVRPGGKDVKDRRQQLRQPLARLLAAHRSVAALVPGPQRLEGALRMRVAHGREGLQRGVAVAGVAEVEGALGRERGFVLEERRVVALHRTQAGEQRLGEVVERVVAEEDGDLRHAALVVRQAVGLAVVRHLQPVLDGAVEGVGLHQLVHRLAAHVAGGDEPVERLPRAAHA